MFTDNSERGREGGREEGEGVKERDDAFNLTIPNEC